MFDCEESGHKQQEVILVCLNMNCKLKRACCLDCIENHSSHKQELKTVKQITQWKEKTIQSYTIYEKQIMQILEIMSQIKTFLNSLNEDFEKSFEEIKNNEFEKQVFNLLKVQQVSSPLNYLISNIETMMEPISEIFSKFDTNLIEACIQAQSAFNNSINQLPTIVPDQNVQYQQIVQKQIQEDNKTLTNNKAQNYLDLLEKTHKLRKENDFDIIQYPLYHIKSILDMQKYKTIILIGTKGSEKQQLINLFLNYYIGVEFSDPYRFEIIDDIDITKETQNCEYQFTKVYYITPLNGKPGIRIIYTEDYNDDLSYDDQSKYSRICEIILRSAQLNQNILIGFVIPQQVQIGMLFMLESILSHFSNSLINNIVFLFPDCVDDYPKQKEILQSKAEVISGITSPIYNMIPTINNSWYLKFNTSILYKENKTKQNQLLWKMGQNSFQLLLQNYLENIIQNDKFFQMWKQQDEILSYFRVNISKWDKNQEKQLNKWSYDLYQPRILDLYQAQEKAEKELREFLELKCQFDQNDLGDRKQYIYLCKDASDITYFVKNFTHAARSVSAQLEKYRKIETPEQMKNNLIYLKNRISDDFLNQFQNWPIYFKLNQILISINPGQQKYYEYLISKENTQKQAGWQNRVKVLNERYNFWIYSVEYFKGSKSPQIEELLNEWANYNFSLDKQSIKIYKAIKWNSCYERNYFQKGFNQQKVTTYDDQLFEHYELQSVYTRLDKDAIDHFNYHIQNCSTIQNAS
ncbi:unnamed protein product [Paramecium octaurelia]|uniref:Uncharacterized protein n=1 Tax=Paramecium octaurelia TaxID=43137 RepID=A0A8S1SB93_PAROT|nr:unnamed protein product [Paramecium octaurelia]